MSAICDIGSIALICKKLQQINKKINCPIENKLIDDIKRQFREKKYK